MIAKQLIPACGNYIKSENRANILYSLAIQMTQNQPITAKEIFLLFQASGIFSKDQLLPEVIENVSCFSIVSDYKCSFICHFCPLSTRYKNQNEKEESMLLSYALKSWDNLQSLLTNGLSSKHFQSLYLINTIPNGDIVATLPLIRLAFAYLENAVSQASPFSKLPEEISDRLYLSNQGKLTEKNREEIQTHLLNLQRNYENPQKTSILELLSRILPNSTPAKPGKDSLIPELKNLSQTTNHCLEGFLDPAPLTTDKPNDPLVPALKQKVEVAETSVLPQTLIPKSSDPKPENPKAISRPEPDPDSDSLFLPSSFSLEESECMGYPIIQIEGESLSDLHQFEAFLLYNPKIAIELVSDQKTGREMLLFYASKLFYYCDAYDKRIIQLLSVYLSKSSERCQICFDPYRLYHFLHRNGLCDTNVFSLRTAHRILAAAQNRNYVKTPAEIIKELVSRENTYHLASYIFAMLHYTKMYEVIKTHPCFLMQEQQKAFGIASVINSFLGISYELREVVETTSPLFTMNDHLDLQFHYQPEWKMKAGYYSVTFSLSADHPLNSLVINILYRFAIQKLPAKFGYRLLSFTKDSLSVATTEKAYPHLCEVVAAFATHLAEKQGLLPIIIEENLIRDKDFINL